MVPYSSLLSSFFSVSFHLSLLFFMTFFLPFLAIWHDVTSILFWLPHLDLEMCVSDWISTDCGLWAPISWLEDWSLLLGTPWGTHTCVPQGITRYRFWVRTTGWSLLWVTVFPQPISPKMHIFFKTSMSIFAKKERSESLGRQILLLLKFNAIYKSADGLQIWCSWTKLQSICQLHP